MNALLSSFLKFIVSMMRAYLLALFSHFVTKLLADLHLSLFGPESLVELFEGKEQEESTAKTEDTAAKPVEEHLESKKKKKRRGLARLKRRRPRRVPGDDSTDEGTVKLSSKLAA